MNKKLYRSATDKVLFGVCGGIAEYFDADSVLVRLFMVIFALTGAGILFYIFAAILMREREAPEVFRRPTSAAESGASEAESYSNSSEFAGAGTADTEASASHAAPSAKRPRTGGRGAGAVIAGLILILIGVFYLINRFVPIFYWIDFRTIFAVVLVLVGIYFVAKR
ncbi:MAG: PspC domain-containing protein [Clostridiales Family XIII bacterium]|nr:PspC domain-containing protein [Clostridiales Family XIII bacterium]